MSELFHERTVVAADVGDRRNKAFVRGNKNKNAQLHRFMAFLSSISTLPVLRDLAVIREQCNIAYDATSNRKYKYRILSSKAKVKWFLFQ